MGSIVSALTDTAPSIPPLDNPKSDEPCALLVNGVCDAWSESHFSQFLSRSHIPFSKATKVRGEGFAIMEFKSNKDRQIAYNFLSGCQLTDQPFEVRPFHGYDPPPMPYATQAEILKFSSLKTQSIYERLHPLADKTPEERISFKLNNANQFLKDIIPKDYVLKIQECPQNCECHTTVELTVGYDENGEIAVGFNNSSRTYVTIAPIDSSYEFPNDVVNIAQQFTNFVKKSPFPPYDNNSITGKWRTILFRVSSTKEIMLIVVTFGGLPLFEIQRLEEAFKTRVKSLYWAKSDQTYYDASTPNRVLLGTPSISEKIGDLKFSIHPFNPFPDNITMYTKIMDRAAELAQLDSSTVFVDLACGIGFDCLYLNSRVKRTVGFDPDEHMINGSNKNTENNEIKTAFFIKESAEEGLNDVANNLAKDEKIVCMLNTINPAPPVSCVRAVMKCPSVKKFIYITDSLYTFAYDCQRLILEGNSLGAPPFKVANIELFDLKPKSQVSKILGFFVRD